VRIEVTDPADPRLDPYRSLRGRPADEGTFVVEGRTTLRQVRDAGIAIRSALVLPKALDAVEGIDAPVYVAERDVLTAVAGFDVHRGVLAVADRPPANDAAVLLRDAARVLVLDGITDAENVGALFRNAAAFAIDAVLLDSISCDPLLRRCVRVSVGNTLNVPFARCDDWRAAISVPVLALTPGGETAIGDVPAIDRFALVVGAEGAGLSADVLAAADHRVRIPMARGVDSLNVATAAAVALSWLTARAPS
jgi:tRNA G18 (ribose-2'-O)-methylase SpoU